MERHHAGMVLNLTNLIKMKKFLSICLLFLLAFSSQAASPSFGSFNTNQFGTNESMISLRRGVALTNPVIRGFSAGTAILNSDNLKFAFTGSSMSFSATNTPGYAGISFDSGGGTFIVNGTGGIYLRTAKDLGLRTNSTVGYVWTATNDIGLGDWKAASGGGGSLTTNANQFGASTDLTIKSGAVVTNLQGWGDFTSDTVTLRNSLDGNPSNPGLYMTNGTNYIVLWQMLNSKSRLDFSTQLDIQGQSSASFINLNSNLRLSSATAADGYVLTSDSIGNSTWKVNPALAVSNQLTTASNFFNARQGGSSILTNIAATGAMTNGLIAGSNMTLTTNVANQVVFTASGGTTSTNLTTLASGSATIGDLTVTNSGSFGSLTNTGTLTANSLGSNAVVSMIGKTAGGQLVETSTGFDPAFIRGLLVTKSGNAAIAVSAGSWYHNASNRVYSLPASTLSLTVSASTLYSVYASVSNSLPVLEAFAENPPATNYFGTARQRASGTIGRWIGHFITDSTSIIAPTGTKEAGANSVSVMYQTPGTILNRILSAGAQTGLTVLTADAICPKYASTEMWSCFQYTYATTALAPLVVGVSLDGTNVISNFAGYVAVANNFVASSGWLPLSTNNTIYYKNTITSPGVAPSLYVDVYGVKYAR